MKIVKMLDGEIKYRIGDLLSGEHLCAICFFDLFCENHDLTFFLWRFLYQYYYCNIVEWKMQEKKTRVFESLVFLRSDHFRGICPARLSPAKMSGIRMS